MAAAAQEERARKVLAQLEVALSSGDHYSALQMYRTVVARTPLAAARGLVVEGCRALAAKGRVHEAADLGDMLVKTLAARAQAPLEPADVDALEAIGDALDPAAAPAAGAGAGAGAGTAAGDAKAHLARVSFLQSALRWAKAAPRAGAAAGAASSGAGAGAGDEEDEEPPETESAPAPASRAALLARLQLRAARACAAGGAEFFQDAQAHYCCAPGAGAEFGAFLHRWAAQGYARERDLFLARGVLHLLCAGNLRDANAARDAVLRLAAAGAAGAPAGGGGGGGGGGAEPAGLDTPLARFVKFLLLCCERDVAARPLFLTLVDKYRGALGQRDPELLELAAVVGQRFFRVEPPRNPMQDMMRSMLGFGGGGGGGGGGGNPMMALPGMMRARTG